MPTLRLPCSITAPTARSTCSALRSEEHTSELQSQSNLVCRLLLETKIYAHPFNRATVPTTSSDVVLKQPRQDVAARLLFGDQLRAGMNVKDSVRVSFSARAQLTRSRRPSGATNSMRFWRGPFFRRR